MNYKTIEELRGKTLTRIEQNGSDELVFECSDGTRYHMYHSQDCCESVNIESIDGALCELIGSPVVRAEERMGHGDPSGHESVTFTDFVIGTEEHEAVIHWVGSSNGYYSEDVYFAEL